MTNEIRTRFPVEIYKDLIVDLEDRLKGETLKAARMVSQHSGLDKKRARQLEGQARFRMMEQGFEQVCELYGGQLLPGGTLPSGNVRVHQPFMRFGEAGKGIILGLASMPQPSALPVKNRSRLAGVSLNWNLSQRLDFDGIEPCEGDIFILFLVARDPEKSGKLKEMAIGAIDSTYDHFLFYQPVDQYLIDSGSVPKADVDPHEPDPKEGSGIVRLKGRVRKFIPPEAGPDVDQEKETD